MIWINEFTERILQTLALNSIQPPVAIMKVNEGTIDRILRVIVGLALLSLVVIGPKSLFGLIGLIPLLTGLIGFCPAYKILGLNTCPLEK